MTGIQWKTLKRHFFIAVLPADRPSCDICGLVFITEYDLINHKESHRANPYECDVCDKRFQRKTSYQVFQKLFSGPLFRTFAKGAQCMGPSLKLNNPGSGEHFDQKRADTSEDCRNRLSPPEIASPYTGMQVAMVNCTIHRNNWITREWRAILKSGFNWKRKVCRTDWRLPNCFIRRDVSNFFFFLFRNIWERTKRKCLWHSVNSAKLIFPLWNCSLNTDGKYENGIMQSFCF